MKKHRRLLLKLSGELLMDGQPFGISHKGCLKLAKVLKDLQEASFEIAIVIGGGNIFRGFDLNALGMSRTPADQMGMLATMMNGLALQQALETIGCPSTVMSAIECPRVVKSYTWQEARSTLKGGQILIFVGGTGNPYFTTDTAAAMRACEIEADVLMKGTKVDGIYNKDPLTHPEAVKYDSLSYDDMLEQNLAVMDAASVVLCRDNHIPIVVFNMRLLLEGKLISFLNEGKEKLKKIGTIVTEC
jgi:uridylate kinase